jgi:hypothetical protein
LKQAQHRLRLGMRPSPCTNPPNTVVNGISQTLLPTNRTLPPPLHMSSYRNYPPTPPLQPRVPLATCAADRRLRAEPFVLHVTPPHTGEGKVRSARRHRASAGASGVAIICVAVIVCCGKGRRLAPSSPRAGRRGAALPVMRAKSRHCS